MSEITDPEVLADLQLRADTMRERGHRADRVPEYVAPKFVTKWQCRACKKLVDITADAVEVFERFNRQLIAQGKPHLDNREIVFCQSCRVPYREKLAEHNTKRVVEMRDVIRQLKASRSPENERAAIKQLEVWGHPDVPGLVQAIRNRIDGHATKAASKPKRGAE